MEKTFNDLWGFIKNADVNEFGEYINDVSFYKLQIHSNKNQCNIIRVIDNTTLCCIVFNPDEKMVRIYKVTNGYCDYDYSLITTNVDTSINKFPGIIGYKINSYIRNLLKS